ncbi:MAG: type II toxin-antitoxin system Phd/YefM family antitoxin [Bdellovibrionales bacterium]
METIDSTNFRKNLFTAMDKVSADHEPLLITRKNGGHTVLLSAEDFASYEEMRHLTASINNVVAINEGIQSLNEGRYTELNSIDDL